MRKSDAIVAELSIPGYGIGYEIAIANVMGLPVLGLVNEKVEKMSAFIPGNSFSNYSWIKYKKTNLDKTIKSWINSLDNFSSKRKGLYIAFEGMNQCGKGTQIGLLVDKLQSLGHSIWQGREPGTTYIGEELRNLSQIQTKEVPDIRTEVSILMAQRAQLIGKEIKDHLLLGEIVISDRSDGTSLAFQGVGRGQDILRVAALNGYAVENIHPDMTIYLRVPRSIAVHRGKTEEEYDRFEHQGEEFEQNCYIGYEEILRLDKLTPPQTWYAIDAIGSPEEVHERVWETIKQYLGLKKK